MKISNDNKIDKLSYVKGILKKSKENKIKADLAKQKEEDRARIYLEHMNKKPDDVSTGALKLVESAFKLPKEKTIDKNDPNYKKSKEEFEKQIKDAK